MAAPSARARASVPAQSNSASSGMGDDGQDAFVGEIEFHGKG